MRTHRHRAIDASVPREPSTLALFLDIDGVLNHHRFIQQHWARGERPDALHQRLDGECVRRLARLLGRVRAERGPCRLVLSSTWRVSRGVAATQQALSAHAPDLVIDDVTPDLGADDVDVVRGLEIARYLDDRPEVTGLVILDDHDDLEPFLGSLVQIDRRVGLTDADADAAFRVLAIGRAPAAPGRGSV